MEQVNRKKIIASDIGLLFVAIFWGSNFVVMKKALNLITPFAYLGLRFTVAGLIMGALFWRRMSRLKSVDLKGGSLLGFLLFAGFGVQTVALMVTTPAKSGFITGTSVVIVPFLYILVSKAWPRWSVFAGAFLALGGLFMLSFEGAEGALFIGEGDLLTLGGAFLFAAHVVFLGVYAPRCDTIILATLQMLFAGILSFVVAFITEPLQGLFTQPLSIWAAVFYGVVFCTIGAFVTQTAAQRFTPPTHAALILSLEAVFAGLFSYLLWDELFTMRKICGAGLIFAGILITELQPLFQARAEKRSLPSLPVDPVE
ncbi:MAG: DMT family transporter [Firmicutes bacterium]|nr:DMT family transporter [Bacillota bacterium]